MPVAFQEGVHVGAIPRRLLSVQDCVNGLPIRCALASERRRGLRPRNDREEK
jgi:hypothetical protein